jgi:hypothetical protein
VRKDYETSVVSIMMTEKMGQAEVLTMMKLCNQRLSKGTTELMS